MNLDRIIAVRNNKTVYRDGNLCIKVFNEDFSKADILNEALNHARVEETGLNVPKLREVTTIGGKWAIVSEYADGKSVSRLMRENPEKRDEYMARIVRIQREIHLKSCPLLSRQKDKINMKTELGMLSKEVKAALKKRLASLPEGVELCHGDFNPSNVIIDKNGDECVIDWAHASTGSALQDAAGTYLWFLLAEDKRGAEEYLRIFRREENVDRECILSRVPLAAAEKLATANERERIFLTGQIALDEDVAALEKCRLKGTK